ncbi:MAG TPA: VOC family protein [Chitinophagaceae bacterium]|jgi:predicted 3-demethylubiquinone-9 3-methyltransferase (glyoxalase superfamily)|nr:VOC family protein [Chitinophagaceae bacterium]
MQKITPFLWFNNNAEEAIEFYTSVFPDTRVGTVTRYPEGAPVPAGTLLTASFTLNGQEFTALNGGPQFSFTEAVSFVIHCQSQEEVDYYWSKLSEGGEESRCGWLKDRFGLSWQVVPTALPRLLSQSGGEKAGRVMQALMQMRKIEISALEAAAA